MRRHKLALMVVAITISAITGAPLANAMPGTMVLRGISGGEGTRAADINNSYVVIGTHGVAPVRWDALGRITELPAPPGLSLMYMREITDSGFIIGNGYRYDGDYLSTAFLWDRQGNRIDLQPLPGSSQTRATDVNSSGTVVGFTTAADGQQHAVRWDPQGRITALPKRPGGNFSYAAAINDHGTVAGYSDVNNAGTHFTHAVKWDAAGRISVLVALRSAMNSQALVINNAGTVAGIRGADTVRWDQLGRATVLQPSGLPTAMNNEGVVVGQVNGEYFSQHPIRWGPQGQGIDLSSLGYATTLANSINATGTVVGISESHSVHPGSWAYARAAQWDPAGNVTDLGNPVGALNAATGINDNGAICGWSGTLNGPVYAVVWNRWSHTH